MYPLANHLAYPLCIGLGAVVGIAVFAVLADRGGIRPMRALSSAALVAVGGMLGGRLYWLVEHGVTALSWSAIVAPGFRHPGILLGVLAAVPLSQRLLLRDVPLARVVDWGAPGLALALGVGRLGCFLGGCCYGTRSDLPWAVHFPPQSPAARLHAVNGWIPDTSHASLAVHPLQLYFVLLALGVGALLLALQRRKAYDGQVFLLFVVLHEAGKFLLEALREPDLGSRPAFVPAASLVLALLAATTLVALRMRAAWRPARSH